MSCRCSSLRGASATKQSSRLNRLDCFASLAMTGRRLTIAVALACALAGAWAAVGVSRAASLEPVWTEMPWPFPTDQWGTGKAFACRSADCGTQVTVYLRAKIGFCNCTTGVADDEELDRISDFELVGNRATAQGPGRPIAVAWMKGRSRPQNGR